MTIEIKDLQKGATVMIEKELKIGGKLLKAGERYSVFMGATDKANALLVKLGKNGKALSNLNMNNVRNMSLTQANELYEMGYVVVA
jgi:hypothetical protein